MSMASLILAQDPFDGKSDDAKWDTRWDTIVMGWDTKWDTILSRWDMKRDTNGHQNDVR